MAKKIQDNDWRYNFLKSIVDRFIKSSYHKIEYAGMERIPGDGAVIFAPNHTGTLMDAMVMLSIDSKPKVFVARADIFKNPKLAKLFRFFKMLPIMRMRDGMDEVKKNNRTIEQAVDVLKDRIPFCIFPEGTHQTKHSLLPLTKGIFRIALQAKEFMPDTPLYIVPVGITYGSFWRYRASARVQIGEPISVGEMMEQNADKTPPELMNIMRVELEKHLKKALYYIPNDENYDATYEICAAVAERGSRDIVATGNATVGRIHELKEKNPTAAAKLFEAGNEAARMRKAKNISLNSVAKKRPLLSNIARALMLLITLPYTLPAALLTSPLLLLCQTIFKKFKDQAFRNSVRFAMNLLIWPLLMVIYAIVAFLCLPWQWALPMSVLALPAPFVIHDAYKTARLLVSDIKLSRNKSLKTQYREIKELLFN